MSDELNPEMRKLVDLARQARTPGAADKRRIAERLAVPLAAGVVVSTAAKSVGAQSLFGALGVKLAAAVALVLAVSAAVVTQRERAPAPTPSALAPGRAIAPPAPLSAAVSVEPASPAPPVSANVAPPSRRPSAPTPSRTVASASELEEEAALLHQAQSAWRAGQSAQALQLASQHAQRFPRSQLANERDVLRVLSLCKLGQVQSAKQVGARLLRSAKGSPWYQSVAASCAAE